jgi:nickel/cobalt transporter (NicO) family protein
MPTWHVQPWKPFKPRPSGNKEAIMKTLRRTVTVLLTLLISFVLVPVALAHPLGNFTINQFVGLHISRAKILVDYVVDMAEIPTFQEIAIIDANGNGQADLSESEGYDADKCASLQPDLNLLLNNRPLTLTLTSSSVSFPAGVGGLPTLRLTCEFQTVFDSADRDIALSFVNHAFSDRIGWKEIVVIPEDVSVQGEFAMTSLSKRLTYYPQDLLSSPLDQRQVELEILPTSLSAQNGTATSPTENSPTFLDRNDAFTNLILMDEITLPAVLLALGFSFLWGAMHALTPGHGKTIVGAYLVGSRGTLKHAVYLGLTTTITHTLGVFALGLLTLFAAKFIVPEKLFPWISLLSGLLVVGIGINLCLSRLKTSSLGDWVDNVKLSLMRSPNYARIAASTASRHLRDGGLSKYSGVSHRYVLAPTKGHYHSHYFDDAHSSDHDHHAHGHVHSHELSHHDHSGHSHTPPESITWRSLLALGVSGGLLPCPSALVVLLGAIALNRIGFGLILVFAFSLGLAGTLTAIGMLFIYAGQLFERFPARGRIIGVLPVFSALFISLIGLGIVVKALAEIGII